MNCSLILLEKSIGYARESMAVQTEKTVRVDFKIVAGGVMAYVKGMPKLRAVGATQEEAMVKVAKLIAAHYEARVGSMQFVLENDPGRIPNARLRALAKKHKPAASWYKEDKAVM